MSDYRKFPQPDDRESKPVDHQALSRHYDLVAKHKEDNQGYEYDIYTDLQGDSGDLGGMEEGRLPYSET